MHVVCIYVHIWGCVHAYISVACVCGVRCVYVHMYAVGSVCVRVCGVCMHVGGVCVCVHLLTGPHTLNSFSYTSGFPSGVNSHLPAEWTVVSPLPASPQGPSAQKGTPYDSTGSWDTSAPCG